jgi:hypothetical protein
VFEKLYIKYLTWAKMLGDDGHLEELEALGSLGVCVRTRSAVHVRAGASTTLFSRQGARLPSWCSVEYSTSILASPREKTGPILTSPGTAFRRISRSMATNPVGRLIAGQHGCLRLEDYERYESARIFYVTAMRRIHGAIRPIASKRTDWSQTASDQYEPHALPPVARHLRATTPAEL